MNDTKAIADHAASLRIAADTQRMLDGAMKCFDPPSPSINAAKRKAEATARHRARLEDNAELLFEALDDVMERLDNGMSVVPDSELYKKLVGIYRKCAP